ncbi:hypothetical protein JXB31_04005 [Candidatus Woesearchaeota archaeon]|nr:hypothetical protein [Candidatus Woesearchaeota archaeon]
MVIVTACGKPADDESALDPGQSLDPEQRAVGDYQPIAIDTASCESESFPITKSACYRELAILAGDISLCEKADMHSASCAIDVDCEKTNTIESLDRVCSFADSPISISACYRDIAIHRGEISLCEKADMHLDLCRSEVESS